VRKSLFVAGILSLSFLAQAEEVLKLDKVQFTATKSEREEKETPASTATITKEELKFERGFNLSESLSEVSGVNAETKNGGYDVRLIIRGGGLNAPYGIRQINILLDGVPITDPDGMTRLDFVNPQLIDQIEIVKGPNSTLYGANAIGGVVNFITKPVWTVQGLKLKTGFGNYNTQLYNLLYGNNYKGKLFYYVDITRRSTDSWREWNEFKSTQASFKIGYLFDDKSSIETYFNYSKADLQLPNSLTKQQFDTDPSKQYKENVWIHSGRYSEIYFFNTKYQNQLTDSFTIKPIFYIQKWSHYHPVTGFINDGGAKVFGTDFITELKHSLFGINSTLISGFQIQHDKYDADKYTYGYVMCSTGPCNPRPNIDVIKYTLSDQKGRLAETDHNKILKYGFYAQETLIPTKNLLIDIGLRWDAVKFDLNQQNYIDYNYSLTNARYIISNSNTQINRTFRFISPKIGFSYAVAPITNIYASFSAGFQTPQWSQLTYNPNLKNTKAYQYEIGTKTVKSDEYSFNTAFFFIDSRDEITQVLDGSRTSFANAGKVNKKGVEIDGRFKVYDGLYIGGSYTYSDFIYKEYIEVKRVGSSFRAYDRSNNRLEYIPKHKYTLYVYYFHPSGFKAKIDTNTWGQYYTNAANTGKYKGYEFLTNLFLGYEKKNLELGFSVYNLTDKKYAVEVKEDSSTPYVPGAPRTYFVYGSYKF